MVRVAQIIFSSVIFSVHRNKSPYWKNLLNGRFWKNKVFYITPIFVCKDWAPFLSHYFIGLKPCLNMCVCVCICACVSCVCMFMYVYTLTMSACKVKPLLLLCVILILRLLFKKDTAIQQILLNQWNWKDLQVSWWRKSTRQKSNDASLIQL